MSLILKFGISDTATCKAFYLYDASGDALPGGWNAGANPNTSSIANATFQMVGQVSGIDKIFTVYPTMPFPEPNTQAPTNVYTIQNTDLDLDSDTNIPSDVYLGTYICYANSNPVFTYEAEGYFYLDCSHNCCLDKMIAQLKNCDCESEKELKNKIISLTGMIASVHAAISPSCNEVQYAIDLVKKINAICAQQNCSCG